MFSSDELVRYARQIAMPEIGTVGQERLRAGRVLIVGAGGLGSPAALYLAAAGVGTLGLIDFDVVDPSNLHRQLLHGTSSIGLQKVDSARQRLADVNPNVEFVGYAESLSSQNALDIVRAYDIVVDASDNFPTRYLVNDACMLSGVPVVYGSVERFEGQISVFGLEAGPCYRCLFREPPPSELVRSCAEAGVLGVIPGLVGTIQAAEVVKLLTGVGEPLSGRLLIVDAKRMRFRSIEIHRDPMCPVCGTHEQTSLIDYEAFCGVSAHAPGPSDLETEPRALAQRLAAGAPVALIDVREQWEYDLARLPGARLVAGDVLAHPERGVPRDRDVVLYCHHGVRSEYWAAALRARGFDRVWHLRGGIDAWSNEVDPTVPRY